MSKTSAPIHLNAIALGGSQIRQRRHTKGRPAHGTQPSLRRPRGSTRRADLMQRIAVWALYGIGALAILYLALYAYAAFTGRDLQPGDPIHIFRRPDAPNYS
jgi:hypothetical protein